MGKTGGLLAFAAGIAAGVAAVLFSDEKNRAVATKKIKEVKREVAKDPEGYARKLAKKAEAKVKKVAKTAKKTASKR